MTLASGMENSQFQSVPIGSSCQSECVSHRAARLANARKNRVQYNYIIHHTLFASVEIHVRFFALSPSTFASRFIKHHLGVIAGYIWEKLWILLCFLSEDYWVRRERGDLVNRRLAHNLCRSVSFNSVNMAPNAPTGPSGTQCTHTA